MLLLQFKNRIDLSNSQSRRHLLITIIYPHHHLCQLLRRLRVSHALSMLLSKVDMSHFRTRAHMEIPLMLRECTVHKPCINNHPTTLSLQLQKPSNHSFWLVQWLHLRNHQPEVALIRWTIDLRCQRVSLGQHLMSILVLRKTMISLILIPWKEKIWFAALKKSTKRSLSATLLQVFNSFDEISKHASIAHHCHHCVFVVCTTVLYVRWKMDPYVLRDDCLINSNVMSQFLTKSKDVVGLLATCCWVAISPTSVHIALNDDMWTEWIYNAIRYWWSVQSEVWDVIQSNQQTVMHE